eukprot:CAMPEP_0168340550 /NCGR_PEP_ID=MMETSP0213-20121227/14129_1 /TAXON_ID=151035 /ORGANISM="Euplotes harpa, Strain FSP1.4" /LENGTH=210 /DNA_ID=CAMNT_0008346805 /DNA_START=328 /DNA_END=957 /DNA_ORIENTATION=-
MNSLISLATCSARERVPKLQRRRERGARSNKSEVVSRNDHEDSRGKDEVSSRMSVENEQYSRTLAFGKKDERGEEYSPVKAYLPKNEDGLLGKSKRKHKHKSRSKSGLSHEGSHDEVKNYDHEISRKLRKHRMVMPTDWLQTRKNKRDKVGGDYMYKQNLPKQLGNDKLASYHDIKIRVNEVERKAEYIEKRMLNPNLSENLIKNTAKVG